MAVGGNCAVTVEQGERRNEVKVGVRYNKIEGRWCRGSKGREPRDVQENMRANDGGARQRCSKGKSQTNAIGATKDKRELTIAGLNGTTLRAPPWYPVPYVYADG